VTKPNPARERVQVRLPLEEPGEPETPSAEHVEAAGWLLTPPYLVAMLTLEVTGCRVGEFEAARLGDLDERRQAWLVRAAVSKTRRARWVQLPDDLYSVVVAHLPAPEDRDPDAPLFPGVTSDRLRMAIARACRDAGVPRFAPHSLRHRFISLATSRVTRGRKSVSVSASARVVPTPVPTPWPKKPCFTGMF
jgi:integrase